MIQSRNTAMPLLRGAVSRGFGLLCCCFFRAHKIFLGRRQLRNQREGAKEPSAPFSQVIYCRKYNPTKQGFKRDLDLTLRTYKGLLGLGNLIFSITSEYLQFSVIIPLASKT